MNPFYTMFGPNGMLHNSDWRMFVFRWSVLTALAWILVGVLGTIALAQAGTVATGVLYAEPGELAWLFALSMTGMGAVIGLFQWAALAELLPNAYRWALATVAGCALAALIGFFLLGLTWMRAAPLAILLVLTFQTLALRHVVRPSVRWIFGNLASMIAAGMLGVATYAIMAGFFDLANPPLAEILPFGQMTLTGVAFSLTFLAPFGFVFGLLTGDLLAWILANKLRMEDGVARIWPVR